MKYQNAFSFDKHIKEAFPNNLSSVYLIVIPSDFERKKKAQELAHFLKKRGRGDSQISYFDAVSDPLSLVTESLSTQSLFGGDPVVVLENIDKLKNNASLSSILPSSSFASFLILTAASMKAVGDFYNVSKKAVVVLDLADEKPWEKQRRLTEFFHAEAKKSEKDLSQDVMPYLFDVIGLDVSALEQELYKLICYVGEKRLISLKDVLDVCACEKQASGWSLSESIVWSKEILKRDETADLSFILALVGQIRYQLQTGFQIATLIEQKKASAEIGQALPSLKPQSLQKFIFIAEQKGRSYFKRGLNHLFDLELDLKSSGLDKELLLDLFICKLRGL